jgi:AraC family transcriptional regulator
MLASFGGVSLFPNDIARRQSATWRGISADILQVTRHEPFEYRLTAPVHLLALLEQAGRRDGETFIEGLPLSRRREYSRTLMFVPAGREFRGWQDPRALLRVTYFYIDPQGPLVDPELRFSEVAFEPRLFFEESNIWDTASKLKRLAERPSASNLLYAEALSIVLAHELVRLNNGHPSVEPTARGGLAGWQKNAVAQHFAEHLADPVSLATMADLAQLSAFHFARAFKQSFGMPPHRYHTSLRIERAKSLLAQPDLSVTEIAANLGFSETSSFSATFRKLTGRTPSDYRRSLE